MPGDTSIFDVAVKLWGINLERLSPEYRSGLMQDLQDSLATGGCFEDEGFLSVPCDSGAITIKPLTWFRSRREALELIMMINRLEG